MQWEPSDTMDKAEETKDAWLEKLNNLHVTRADMNRLIMNYLLTGIRSYISFYMFICLYCNSGLLQHVDYHIIKPFHSY